MAGAGFKTFNTGDVFTASDANTYLMQQTVMVFASAAARTSALGANVAEGMMSYLKDTDAVEVYNGSAWVASDDPNAIQNTIVDAKGDLIAASASDTPARLAVGTNGQYLSADSSTATGLKWVTPDSGKIKQVVTGTLKTTLTGSSTTFADTGLSVTITPTSNTSTILINAVLPLGLSSGAWAAFLTLTDGSNNILIDPTSSGSRTKCFVRYEYGNQYTMEPQSLVFLHSPATTSAVTYKVRYRVTSASAVATINRAAQDADSDAYGQGISTINVMEIGA